MFRWNRYHDCDHALNPWVGGGCGNSQGWVAEAAQRPGRGLSMPLVSSHRSPSSRGSLAKAAQFARWRQMGPQRNITKGFFVSECISAEEGNVMRGTHGWAFNPSKSKPHFLFWERGRWQERKPKGQDVANIQMGRAFLWNEHVGRGMNFRSVVTNETPRFILKWNVYENGLVPAEKEPWELKEMLVCERGWRGTRESDVAAGGRQEAQQDSPWEEAGKGTQAASLEAGFSSPFHVSSWDLGIAFFICAGQGVLRHFVVGCGSPHCLQEVDRESIVRVGSSPQSPREEWGSGQRRNRDRWTGS